MMGSIRSSRYFEIDHSQTSRSLGFKQFQEKEDLAFNVLTYGAKLRKLSRMGRYVHTCFFYVLEEDDGILQWLSQKKAYQRSRIQLRCVTHLYDNVPEIYRQANHLNTAKLLRIVTSDQKELVLLFESIEEKDIWQNGLQQFILRAMDRHIMGNPTRNMVTQLFQYADKDFNQTLSFDEVKRVIQRMHIQVNNRYLKEFYLKYDGNRNGTIEIDEFQNFIDDLMLKEELKTLFRQYHRETDGPGMSLQSLQHFFEKEQQQRLTLPELQNVITQLGETSSTISYFTFVNILFSPHNSISDTSKYHQEMDMNQPLTYYYIHSSHNTYLLSNQLTGKSSLQAYVNAFKRGVKCVELDCWDGKEGEPVVYHGHTLTSKIYFSDILRSVLEYGFCLSPYPVLLSLEIHCGAIQQQKMAKYLKSILKDQLFLLPPEFEKYTHYPSPVELKNKVIVKGVGKLQHLSEKVGNVPEIEMAEISENEDDSIENIFEKSLTNIPKDILESQKVEKQKLQLKLTLLPQEEDTLQYMSIQDEITFEEHNLKHQVPSPPKLSSRVYTRFNVNNPDFSNFLKYHHFLDNQSKSTFNNSRQSDSFPFQIEQGSWMSQEQWTARSNDINESKRQNNAQSPFQKKLTQPCEPEYLKPPPVPTLLQIPNRPLRGILKSDQQSVKVARAGSVVLPEEIRNKSITREGTSMVQKRKQVDTKKKVIAGTHIDLERCLTLMSAKLSYEPKRQVWHITSLSETQLEVLMKKNISSLVKYHKRYFSRIYPKGTRFDSSNYDPMPGFIVGSQIIALNYQTTDEHLLLNITLFNHNRNQGYVLKPDFLLKDPSPSHDDPQQFYNQYFSKPKLRLILHFISGQQLRPENEKNDKDVVDPYIHVTVKGIQIDELNNLPKRSNIVKNNGFNPIFNFTVDVQIACPELAYLVIKAFDQDVLQDDRLGMNIISCAALRPGYRVLPLLDSKLSLIENSYLFIHLKIIQLNKQ